jgi:hypothetical protein
MNIREIKEKQISHLIKYLTKQRFGLVSRALNLPKRRWCDTCHTPRKQGMPCTVCHPIQVEKK